MVGIAGKPKLLWLVAALCAMLLTSGCFPNQEAEKPVVDVQSEQAAVDLRAAKSTTMANEREMVAVIDSGDVVKVKQNETSSLLRCADDKYTWTGQIYVTLAPGADASGYLQAIKDAWASKDGWTVSERTTAQGQPVIDINSEAGYTHGIDYSKKNHAIRIMSFSPCFTMNPPYEYGIDY